MEKANMFHTRMMEGLYEPDYSGTKKLAISKLMNGSFGEKLYKKKKSESEEDYLTVSSDDEIYEIIFLNDHSEDITPNLFPKSKLQNHYLRQTPKFDAKNNRRKVEQECHSGNKNIRIQELMNMSKNQYNGDVKLPVSKYNQNIGTVKDVVLISHLSPSRSLGVY